MWKNIGKKSIQIIKLIYALIVLSLLILLCLTMLSALSVETNTNNTIALLLGIFSVPGILISFKTIFEVNKKKVLKVTTHCHKCKHLSDLRMEEY